MLGAFLFWSRRNLFVVVELQSVKEVMSMDDFGGVVVAVLHLVTAVIQLATAILMYKAATKKNRRK